MFLETPDLFTFQFVYIKPIQGPQRAPIKSIYIPVCLYKNKDQHKLYGIVDGIYIPVCLYKNQLYIL